MTMLMQGVVGMEQQRAGDEGEGLRARVPGSHPGTVERRCAL